MMRLCFRLPVAMGLMLAGYVTTDRCRAAHPAPASSSKSAADDEGWSETVDGLRMRLALESARIPSRNEMALTLELENVGKSRFRLLRPDVLPSISKPGLSGYPKDHTCNTVITAEIIVETDARVSFHPTNKYNPATPYDLIALEPGQRLRVEIDASRSSLKPNAVSRRSDADLAESLQPAPPKPILVRAAARFEMDWPDTYRMEATYTVDADPPDLVLKEPNIWKGKLKSKPVSITITGEKSTSRFSFR